MPKQKTKKRVLKRIKITGTGKLLRGSQMARHRKSHKKGGQIRRYRRDLEISKGFEKMIKNFLPGT